MSGYGSTGYDDQTRQTDEYDNRVQETGYGDQTRQTDEYGNPIHQTSGEYGTDGNIGVHVTHTGAGEHGAGGNISDGEYGTGGNTVVTHNTGTGGEFGTGVLDHGTKEHDKDGILRRFNSSSSSSEDDEQGGRRKKKSIVDKIKDKLPGGKKESVPTIDSDTYDQGHGATTTTSQEGYGHDHEDTNTAHETYGTDGQPEKKGFIEKIKEKLPGGHN